jgi:hypothetical protein
MTRPDVSKMSDEEIRALLHSDMIEARVAGLDQADDVLKSGLWRDNRGFGDTGPAPGARRVVAPPSETSTFEPALRGVHGGGELVPFGGQADLPGQALAQRHEPQHLTVPVRKPRMKPAPSGLLPKPGKAYQGVTALTGMPGSGKTYSLAQIGLEALGRGERVYCNAGFDLEGCEVYSSMQELIDLEGPAVILIDEAPLYFNARKWQEFPDGFLYRLTQIRKDGFQLYYTSISWEMVDVNLRRMTFWVWECESLTSKRFRRHRFPAQERRQKDERPRERHRVRINPAVCAAYDTFGKVAVASSTLKRKPKESERWAIVAAGDTAPAGATVPSIADHPPIGSFHPEN